MSEFNTAITVVLAHEGGYCDVKEDAGGETNYGISMRFITTHQLTPAYLGLPSLEHGCLKGLTKETAIKVYRDYFWNVNYCALNNQTAATKIFDLAVNAGGSASHKIAQRAAGVQDDGVIGPKTVNAINAMGDKFVPAMCVEQAKFYQAIVDAKPSQVKFLAGWLKRAKWGM